MDEDGKFIARWKPIHEKSIVNYVLIESLIYLACMAVVTIIFLRIYPHNSLTITENGLYFVIILNVLSFLIFVGLRLISWFSGEKRYRKITYKKFD